MLLATSLWNRVETYYRQAINCFIKLAAYNHLTGYFEPRANIHNGDAKP